MSLNAPIPLEMFITRGSAALSKQTGKGLGERQGRQSVRLECATDRIQADFQPACVVAINDAGNC